MSEPSDAVHPQSSEVSVSGITITTPSGVAEQNRANRLSGATTTPFVPPRSLADLRVWAPHAHRVRLAVTPPEGAMITVPMTADAQPGWFGVAPSDLAPLADLADIDSGGTTSGTLGYGLLINDATDPVPDPRSARLPDGVHGLSALYSVDPEIWHDGDWAGRDVRGAVIYEMHVGTFTDEGTLDSAIERLDYLVDLGVDMVEPLPLNAFNGTHNWGYDGVGWYAVQESYGGPAAFARFVDACHVRGLGVVLDVVYNHLGPSGNYLPDVGPYLGAAGTGWGASLNLDGPDSDEVRLFILENALRWFAEFHVDALRLDAVHALVDHRAVHLLEALARATERLSGELGRPLSLIAESDLNDPRMVLPPTVGGYGLTAQWDDDIHHAIHTMVSGERQGYYGDFGSYACMSKVLRGGFFHDGTYSSFRGRHHGRPIPRTVPTTALLAYTCDHDQIGNRATGDRPSAYLDHGQLAIKAALVLLSPFTPMLFMGEEWAARTPFQFFTSHPEPELGEATARGRKAEFAAHGWDADEIPDPQDPATFLRSKLDWTEPQSPANARMHDFYRDLITLRKGEPDFCADDFGSVTVDYDEDAGWFAMHRGTEWSVLTVLGPAPGSTTSGATSCASVTVPIPMEPVLSWEPVESTETGLVSAVHNVIIGRRR